MIDRFIHSTASRFDFLNQKVSKCFNLSFSCFKSKVLLHFKLPASSVCAVTSHRHYLRERGKKQLCIGRASLASSASAHLAHAAPPPPPLSKQHSRQSARTLGRVSKSETSSSRLFFAAIKAPRRSHARSYSAFCSNSDVSSSSSPPPSPP